MPVNAQKLCQEMLAATNRATNAYVAQKKLGKAIEKHLLTNTIVSFTWTGVSTILPFEPDPMMAGTGKVTGIVINLIPDFSNKPMKPLITMANQIRAGVMAGLYNINPPWACSPGSLISIPPLKLSLSRVSSREQAMLKMATEIVTWYIGYVPSIPCAGMRTKYVGVATPIKIS